MVDIYSLNAFGLLYLHGPSLALNPSDEVSEVIGGVEFKLGDEVWELGNKIV